MKLQIFKEIAYKLFSIASLIGFFFLMKYLGFKGILGFVLGMILITILLTSNNPLLLYLLNYMSGEDKEHITGYLKKRHSKLHYHQMK